MWKVTLLNYVKIYFHALLYTRSHFFLQDLDVLAAHLNELGADDKATTTVIIEDDKSDEEEEEEVVNRDGTLLASEPARPL